MLKIRLKRVGKKKQPYYRIIVADSRAPREGAFVERIGLYHPLQDPPGVELDKERAKDWLKKGAQPSEAVHRIFKWQKLYEEAGQT
ncbi:MAG: 30S ribosomal protein S16 [SAR202 cluster bacterium]|nr:30S ribosomal protein S16 [SAR202 cluster bacterium]